MSCCPKIFKRKKKEDLESTLKSAEDKLVVLYFFASWRRKCKLVDPKLKELTKRYADKVVVLKVDIDVPECMDIIRAYKFDYIPAFFFIKNGQTMDSLLVPDPEALEKLFTKHAK